MSKPKLRRGVAPQKLFDDGEQGFGGERLRDECGGEFVWATGPAVPMTAAGQTTHRQDFLCRIEAAKVFVHDRVAVALQIFLRE